ncbi:MAG: polysaccharide deacetylase family protein [Methanospirillum sp.]
MTQLYEKLRQHAELWDLFTRKEEYSPRKLDEYDCFNHEYSENRDIEKPVVSKFLIENGLDCTYPGGKPFAVCLTHDVDEVYPPPSHTILSSLACIKNRQISRLPGQLFWKRDGNINSPYRNFAEIMDLEEKYGAQSSFYFLATDADIKRPRYTIEELQEDLGRIVDRGWEVGLHGGYYAYNDLEAIVREKDRIERVVGRKVTGYRNHYLRFKVPDTWVHLARAGFEYDTTLGYNDAIGFRNGMCHPFHPVDRNNNGAVLDILEIPLAIMDATLISSMKTYDEAMSASKRLVDVVESLNGVITLNWHSNNFNCPFRDLWEKFYEDLLRYCSDKNGWLTTGENIWRSFNCQGG